MVEPDAPPARDALPAASAREEAKRETRRALVRAAAEAFAAEGIDGPSLDAICDRAGKTRGAFYVHFQSRDELVLAVMEELLGAVVDGVLGPSDEAGSLEATVGRFVELTRSIGPGRSELPGLRFHQLLDACWREPRLRASVLAVLGGARERLAATAHKASDSGAARSDLAGPETANLLLLMALGLVVAEELGMPLDLDRTRAALLSLLRPMGDSPRP